LISGWPKLLLNKRILKGKWVVMSFRKQVKALDIYPDSRFFDGDYDGFLFDRLEKPIN